MARKKIDLLPVSLKELKVSAFHRVWIKIGSGIQVRARATGTGYDLRVRYGKDDTIKKMPIRVEYGAHWANGNYRPTLSCSKCGKLAFQNLYLDTSDWTWKCAACHGVKSSWQIRTPMKWDVGEETKFRKLLRRKIDEDILKFELAALRTLSPSEFFSSRPYLVPPWVERVKMLDESLHKRLLKILHNKYKAVMMRRRIQFLNEKELQWLMEKLDVMFEKSSKITTKEVTWLRNRKPQLQSSSYHGGSQLGSRSEESDLLPTVTDSLSKRMSSAAAMNVALAEVLEKSPATNAAEQAATNEESETSSVLSANTET